MNDMRAALYDRYGPPEVLYEGRVPVPVRQPGEVLVRVHAASVNGGELYGRAGKVRLVTGRRFPQRTGLDFVGEVAEVDPTVTGPRAGDRVWGLLGRTFGSAAEYVSVRPRQIAYAPGNVTPTEAVSLLAAWYHFLTALRDKAGLRAGERLLVRGASGGVGSVAVQLGKALGAHVTGLASAKNLDFVRDLGADEALDHRATPLRRPGPLRLHHGHGRNGTPGAAAAIDRRMAVSSPSRSTSTIRSGASATCWARPCTAVGASASSAETRSTTCSPS